MLYYYLSVFGKFEGDILYGDSYPLLQSTVYSIALGLEGIILLR